MRAATVSLAGVLIVAGLSISQGASADAFDFQQTCASQNFNDQDKCRTFINGVMGGIMYSPHPTICFPRHYDSRVSVRIVRRYMVQHPAMLNGPSAVLIRAALADAYPCD